MLPQRPSQMERACVRKAKGLFTLLATKFFVTRVTGRAKIDPSAENVERLIDEAFAFF